MINLLLTDVRQAGLILKEVPAHPVLVHPVLVHPVLVHQALVHPGKAGKIPGKGKNTYGCLITFLTGKR